MFILYFYLLLTIHRNIMVINDAGFHANYYDKNPVVVFTDTYLARI